jgi:hypothetical protein
MGCGAGAYLRQTPECIILELRCYAYIQFVIGVYALNRSRFMVDHLGENVDHFREIFRNMILKEVHGIIGTICGRQVEYGKRSKRGADAPRLLLLIGCFYFSGT